MLRASILNNSAFPRLLLHKNPLAALKEIPSASHVRFISQIRPIQHEDAKSRQVDDVNEALDRNKLPYDNTQIKESSSLELSVKEFARRDSRALESLTDNHLRIGPIPQKSTDEEDTYKNMTSRPQMMELYEDLLSGVTNLDSLSTHLLGVLGHISLEETTPNLEAMQAIFSAILRRWTPRDKDAEGPETGMWTLFCLLPVMSKLYPDSAKWYFRDLLRARSSWPQGSTDVIESVNDQTAIMSVFMLRCCIGWGWWRRAFIMANELLSQPALERQSVRAVQALLIDLMRRYIASGSKDFDPHLCAALICSMADHPLFPPVDDAFLQLFYKECMDSPGQHISLASQVYLYLRDKTLAPNYDKINPHAAHAQRNLNKSRSSNPPYVYPLPSSHSMISLLKYYRRINDQNAAHLLVREAQRHIHSMSAKLLAPYLDCLIQLSFTAQAREVYSMCEASQDVDQRSILRHPGLVRRLVTLFVSKANTSYQHSQEDRRFAQERQLHATKATDYMEFAKAVVRRFKKVSTPLRGWDHHHLTTLARISFEIGYFRDGMVALEAIIERPELVPDAHDLSVSLLALGSGDPQTAMDLLEFMIRRGIEPDDSAYGVVAAQFLKHNNPQLAHKVLSSGLIRGRTKWNRQLLGAICWHSISRENLIGLSRRDVIHRLRLVLRILGENSEERETVFRERTLGIRAADVAMQMDRPDIALQFWSRCIQHKSIIRQPEDARASTGRDPEKLLRTKILKALESDKGDNTAILSLSTKELLENAPRVRPVKHKRGRLDLRHGRRR